MIAIEFEVKRSSDASYEGLRCHQRVRRAVLESEEGHL